MHESSVFGPIRTALFVPGNRPDRVGKAANAGADIVIIDLEDAVPISEKEGTRRIVREKIREMGNNRITVRVNGVASGIFKDDLDAVLVEEIRCILVPKVETGDDISEIHQCVLEMERKRHMEPGWVSVIPFIESAKGVQNIFQILTTTVSPRRVRTVAFGAADFTTDMGIEITSEGTELHYPRARIAVACRATGNDPPIDTPYMADIRNIEGLKVDAKRAKQLGFQGKLCIHPIQVEPCNAIFSPTADEISYAERVIRVFEASEAEGVGALQLDGKFIDYPIVERCRRILAQADLIRSKN
jgi:citrate lyase subunit beta/citryl-CoA lyase